MFAMLLLVCAAEPIRVEGKVVKVDGAKVTIERINGRRVTVDAGGCPVYRDRKKADFSAIKVGLECRVHYDQDSKAAVHFAIFDETDKGG